MKTLITVPMKDPKLSKTRLSGGLSDAARSRLARLLYRRTLDFLHPIAEKTGDYMMPDLMRTGADLSVVTGSAVAGEMARSRGVAVIADPDPCTLSEAVATASCWACRRGYDRFCVIPADLIAPRSSDLMRFLESPGVVTICPSADQGKNALLVAPPDAIGFHYGPGSARAHFKAAQAVGLRPVLMPLDSLSFDLDSSDCLHHAMEAAPDIRAVCQ